MKKEYIAPTMQVRISNFDLMKAYPWPESQMPATGGYAWPQDVNDKKWGNLW